MKKVLVIVSALFVALSSFAEKETVDGIEWTYTVDFNGKAMIYNNSTSSAIPIKTAGAITIPSTLGGHPVGSIGIKAFYNCTQLTAVSIPDSVTVINDYAFYGCKNITGIAIPNGVRSIPDYAFSGCTGLQAISLPDGLTSIGTSAFFRCTSLSGITIPAGVEEIGDSAFYFCTGLTEISIPGSVERIGEGAFEGCEGLTEVTIGYGVESIGPSAFADCSKLKRVTIPGTVTGIGSLAFEDCPVNSVTICCPGEEFAAFKGVLERAGLDLETMDILRMEPPEIDEDLVVYIDMVDGEPVISWEPDLPSLTYTVFGKADLEDGEWSEISLSEGGALDGYHFFKVTAERK